MSVSFRKLCIKFANDTTMENLKVEDIISQASMLASEATRISTQLYQKTKELGTTTSYYDTESSSNILEDLESSYDAKKLVALQKLLALMTKGEDVSSYFAPVIKNVASSSFPVKRLIYLYLLHYAEIEPDLTLLSINTIQKGTFS